MGPGQDDDFPEYLAPGHALERLRHLGEPDLLGDRRPHGAFPDPLREVGHVVLVLRGLSPVNRSAEIAGSRRVQSPQYTPTIERSFSNARFKAIFGISPAAKPITRSRPRQPVARSAGSV